MAIIDSAFPYSSSFDDTCLYVWYTQQERENRTNWECDGAERPCSRKGGQKLHWIHWIRVDSFLFFYIFRIHRGPSIKCMSRHLPDRTFLFMCVFVPTISLKTLYSGVYSVPCLTWTIDHLILSLTIFVYFFCVCCLLFACTGCAIETVREWIDCTDIRGFQRALWFVRKWASVTPSGRLHPEAVALWWRMPDYLNSLIPSLV